MNQMAEFFFKLSSGKENKSRIPNYFEKGKRRRFWTTRFFCSIRASKASFASSCTAEHIFIGKISSVAPPWGTWIKDTLLLGLRREEKSPAPGRIQTHDLKSFATICYWIIFFTIQVLFAFNSTHASLVKRWKVLAWVLFPVIFHTTLAVKLKLPSSHSMW